MVEVDDIAPSLVHAANEVAAEQHVSSRVVSKTKP
jgi:hypothetical protein